MAYESRQKEIFEIIEEACRKRKREEKIKVMKTHESWALKDVLRGFFDTTLEWSLPKGATPPFTPSHIHNHPKSLRRANRDFKYLVKGGPGDDLNTWKRENIFIGMLETIHPEDAKLVVKMINREKIDGLTRVVVEEAFPGLLRDSEK